MPNFIHSILLFLCLFVAGSISQALPHHTDLTTTQEIELSSGWNLISIQVDRFNDSATGFPFSQLVYDATPNDLDDSDVPLPGEDNDFELDVATSQLTDAWTFDNDSKTWRGWRNPAATPALPIPAAGQALIKLIPGRGYWIRVTETCTLRVRGIPWDGSHALTSGWNLVGFPGLPAASQTPFTLQQVLGDDTEKIEQAWSYNAGSEQAFVGYDPNARPSVTDLNSVIPGKAYWLYTSGADFIFATDAIPQLPPDADRPDASGELSPDGSAGLEDQDYDGNGSLEAFTANADKDDLDRNGSFDDGTDLNGNGTLDDGITQDVLRFDFGDDTETIIVTNRNASIANWSLIIHEDAAAWLTADQSKGAIATASSFINLTVDRSGITAGIHRVEDAITLYLGSQTKTIDVVLRVAPVAGDWKGYATTTRVNGKNISLGAVDLALSMFMDNEDKVDETFFRGVINRDRSLLFPNDVFMTGVFYSDTSFTMTTNFPMPPAERNMPPFDRFSDGDTPIGRPSPTTVFADSDPDSDAKLSHSSPFPFEIFREITLIGERTSANRLEGAYIESIQNTLPDNKNIFVEGTFVLTRESSEPTRKSIHNKSKSEIPARTIGGTAAQNPFTSTITFDQSVKVDDVQIELGIAFDAPEDLTITLRGPNGITVLVHNQAETLPTTFSTDVFNGILADVNTGDWVLTVAWDETSGERGYFNGWQLRVGGFVFRNVSGIVVDDNNNPIQGASVGLSGHNLLTSASTDAAGAFTFQELTSDNYLLSVTAPNYRPVTRSFRLRDADIAFDGQPDNEDKIALAPVSVTNSLVVAAPQHGITSAEVPFTTTLSAFFSAADLVTAGSTPLIEWDLSYEAGNFQAEPGLDSLSFETTFPKPGAYVVACRLSSNNALIANPATLVITAGTETTDVYPDGEAIDFYFTRTAYVGSIGARTTAGQHGVFSDGNVVYQESKRDSASFDVDRSPAESEPTIGQFDPNEEDTEVTANDSDYTSGAGYDAYTPAALPQRFRMITTMGGYVFGTAPAKAGDFVLRSGRIEE